MNNISTQVKNLINPLTLEKSFIRKTHPSYLKVPKDFRKNLLFRKEIIRLCVNNEDYAKEIRRECKKDILFYLNTFAWTYNPKNKPGFKVMPVITYVDYQDYTIVKMLQCIREGVDFVGDKSRDMGVTWILIWVYAYLFHFFPMESLLLVSRNEKYVEDKGNPKSLFWKFDFHFENLPMFLRPVIENTSMHRMNKLNGSVVDGESTTGDVARGDRRSSIGMDEFAAVKEGYEVLRSTRDATDCRIFISTPKGANNAFYDVGQLPGIFKVSIHWTLHPGKTLGLYRFENGQLKIYDTSYPFPSNYQFINWGDFKWSSVWYDIQRKRCVSDTEAAQELDINYIGSGKGFFDAEFIKSIYVTKHCTPPWVEGEIVIDDDETLECHFQEKLGGRLKLWTNLDSYGTIDREISFGIAGDISAGTGASNSVLSIGNLKTGEKLGQYTCNKTSPEKFAKIAVAIAKLFNNAFMIWEMNGPGHIFANKIIDDYNYSNIYYRQNDTAITKKVSDLPGWWNVGDAKIVLLGIYRNAIAAEKFINHYENAVLETLQYVYTVSGVEHTSVTNKNNDNESKKYHGDMVIADALLQKLFEQYAEKAEEEEKEIPEFCLAARNAEFERLEREQEEDGD